MNREQALSLLRTAIVNHQAEELASGSVEDRIEKLRTLLAQGTLAIKFVSLSALVEYCYEHGLHERDDEIFIAVQTLDPQP